MSYLAHLGVGGWLQSCRGVGSIDKEELNSYAVYELVSHEEKLLENWEVRYPCTVKERWKLIYLCVVHELVSYKEELPEDWDVLRV